MSFFSNLKELSRLDKAIAEKNSQIAELDSRIADKQGIIDEVKAIVAEECGKERAAARETADAMIEDAEHIVKKKEDRIPQLDSDIEERTQKLSRLNADYLSLNKKYDSVSNKYLKLQDIYKSIQYAADYYADDDPSVDTTIKTASIGELLSPSVQLKAQSQDVRELRKRANNVRKQIETTQKGYEDRYTTKTAKALYQFMVLALQAELQNIIYNLRYDKLDKNLAALEHMISKFELIAVEGNQTIAPTIRKFLLQMKSLFTDLIMIEYEYYVQQERIKEEQREIREQMRMEAAEKRELERQQKQLEKEESKYNSEIENLRAQLNGENQQNDTLINRIKELETMLQNLADKKEEIINRANGQAGNVYVISNLGSFGEDVFKVGMTRRLDPQERVNELGDASVPFSFDVHSFIFSENAVALETALHAALNDKRVNKVNQRKEFFRVTLDELEELVYKFEPSASFSRTMLAEQYRQTLAIEQDLVDIDTAPMEGEDGMTDAIAG